MFFTYVKAYRALCSAWATKKFFTGYPLTVSKKKFEPQEAVLSIRYGSLPSLASLSCQYISSMTAIESHLGKLGALRCIEDAQTSE